MRKRIYNFERLLKKYSAPAAPSFLVQEGTGEWIAGDWIAGEPAETLIEGIFEPVSAQMQFQSGGALSAEDGVFITKTALPLDKSVKLKHAGNLYTIMALNDFHSYAGFYEYTLKRVDSLDQSV